MNANKGSWVATADVCGGTQQQVLKAHLPLPRGARENEGCAASAQQAELRDCKRQYCRRIDATQGPDELN
jgi:hypothetical protein